MTKANSKGMNPNGRLAYDNSQFVKGLHAIYDHPDYTSLKPVQKALLWDLCRQYNGHNNGDLSLAENIMRKWGWCKHTVLRNKQALMNNDWIFVTGHKKARNGVVYLYGLTWLEINECDGKLYGHSYSHKKRSLKSASCNVTLLNFSKGKK